MLSAFVHLFGEYPFMDEKYGHAEWGASYGMEHQTITSMGDPTERRVAHELAHMWWGDMITLDSYHHMWLNEGFARYAEALWAEQKSGSGLYHSTMNSYAYYGGGTIYVEDPVHDNVFHFNLEYNKGAWVLHMLRHVVGDSTFFNILQAYGSDSRYQYGTATTEQFRDVAEAISGLELDSFFDQWIYHSYFPHYGLNYHQDGDSLRVTISQDQAGPTIFEMPIDLKIICDDTLFITKVRNYLPIQEYAIELPADDSLIYVAIDPDNWILKRVTYLHNEDEVFEPEEFKIHPPYPNPFNSGVTIRLDLPDSGSLAVKIYDLRGNLVTSLFTGYHLAGQAKFSWLAEGFSSGLYFGKIRYNNSSTTVRLLHVK